MGFHFVLEEVIVVKKRGRQEVADVEVSLAGIST